MKVEMTTAEAAAHFERSTKQIERWREDGKIEAFQVNKRWRYVVDMPDPEPALPAPVTLTAEQFLADMSIHVRSNVEAALAPLADATGDNAAAIRRLEDSLATIASSLPDVVLLTEERARLVAEVDRLKGELAMRPARRPWWQRWRRQ